MNVYDTANKLAEEIKTSTEYVNLKKWKGVVNLNQALKEKLEAFEKARYEVQIAAMQGKEAIDGKTEAIQKMYIELMQDEQMKQYFDAEYKFNVMLGDVNKIIGQAVKEIIED